MSASAIVNEADGRVNSDDSRSASWGAGVVPCDSRASPERRETV